MIVDVKYSGASKPIFKQIVENEKIPYNGTGLLYFLKNRDNHRSPLGLIINMFAHNIPNAIL